MIEIADLTNKIASAELLCTRLGNLLKAARLHKNMTQRELAKNTGLSRGKIIEAERGAASAPTVAAIIVSLDLYSDALKVLSYEFEVYVEPKKIKAPKRRQRASGARKVDVSNGTNKK